MRGPFQNTSQSKATRQWCTTGLPGVEGAACCGREGRERRAQPRPKPLLTGTRSSRSTKTARIAYSFPLRVQRQHLRREKGKAWGKVFTNTYSWPSPPQRAARRKQHARKVRSLRLQLASHNQPTLFLTCAGMPLVCCALACHSSVDPCHIPLPFPSSQWHSRGVPSVALSSLTHLLVLALPWCAPAVVRPGERGPSEEVGVLRGDSDVEDMSVPSCWYATGVPLAVVRPGEGGQ